jgi:SAM-dependent methyltransferase
MTGDLSAVFDTVFTTAAAGRPVSFTLHHPHGGSQRFDPAAWFRDHLPGDRSLLDRCTGPTLDVGCGPGRLAGALARTGRPALGIDISATAVHHARRRGATALRRDVFGPLPGTGRWHHLLLADGNIGIGGDPVALLSRVARLLRPGGRVVADVAPPGAGLVTHRLVLECGTLRSDPFPWTVVGADAVHGVASGTGLRLDAVHEADGRWFAVLVREPC